MKKFLAIMASFVFILSVNAQNACGIQANVTNANCNQPGSIDLVLLNPGPGNYTYQWSNNATTQDLNNLNPGSYTVVVTYLFGGNGCQSTTTATVQQVGNPPAAWISGANVICGGGTTTLTANGGGTYQWSTGSNSQQINVGPGQYAVTVNLNGCTSVASVFVGTSQPPTVTINGNLSVCAGTTTTLTANGGGTYQWSNGSNNQQINVGPGQYAVTVTSALGCTASASVTVNGTVGMNPVVQGTCDGATITGLTAGTYTMTLTNANGCTYSTTFNVGGQMQTWYKDADGDNYGNSSQTIQSCIQPNGYVLNGTDCNDSNFNVHPNATEVCDGVDNNCNGQTDEGLGSIVWYHDEDNDGYGNPAQSVQSCTQPAGYVNNNSDCNDWNSTVHPNAPELCGDNIDNNCNGVVDENCCNTTGISNNMGIQNGATFCPTTTQFFLNAPGNPSQVSYTWSDPANVTTFPWQLFASTSAGWHSYWVWVHVNGTDPADDVKYCFEYEIQCLTGGGEAEMLNAKINISPNPFSSNFLVEIPNGQYEIQVLNTLGDVLKSTKETGDFNFDGSDLPPGVYVMNIVSEKGKIAKKIVKQ